MKLISALFTAAALFAPISAMAIQPEPHGVVGISVDFPFGPIVTSKVIVGGPAVQYSTHLPGAKSWYNVEYTVKPTPAGTLVEIVTKAEMVSISSTGEETTSKIAPATNFIPYGSHQEFDIVLKVDPKHPLEATGTVIVWKT